jgi:hypothetical protein
MRERLTIVLLSLKYSQWSDLVQAPCVNLCNSMDPFVRIADLVPFIMEGKACIRFLFDEGLLNTRMVCSEWYVANATLI